VKVIDPKLLKSVRLRPCEVEGCEHPTPAESHHVYTRGAGQIDLPCNLIALCHAHHYSHHYNGTPSTADLLAIVARREDTTVEAIQETIWRLRRTGKDGKALREDVDGDSAGRVGAGDEHNDSGAGDVLRRPADGPGQELWEVVLETLEDGERPL
jgi:hypothetical protein